MILIDTNLLVYVQVVPQHKAAREWLEERLNEPTGLTLFSADRGFARFSSLLWKNPLKPKASDQAR